MRIYYFNGNKVKGIDLTSELEYISIKHQKAALGISNAELRIVPLVSTNPNAIEGEHEDRLYYLHKYVIKWCKKRSLKAFLIRIVGVNIEKL